MWFLRFTAGSRHFDISLKLLGDIPGWTKQYLLTVVEFEARSHNIAPETVEFDKLLLHYSPEENL